ncbi:hypothetical protein SESBI_09364 [Sesbania bispinosa]|nr:hypothetical protein SESBI_09364 [Sesbania bispinosa]
MSSTSRFLKLSCNYGLHGIWACLALTFPFCWIVLYFVQDQNAKALSCTTTIHDGKCPSLPISNKLMIGRVDNKNFPLLL